MPKKSRACASKGYRYIKKAGTCLPSCKYPQYRTKVSPYHCRTPKFGPKLYKKCKSGMRRSKKTGLCMSKK
jgi:hypothetical protein